jgi:hypothetical protein
MTRDLRILVVGATPHISGQVLALLAEDFFHVQVVDELPRIPIEYGPIPHAVEPGILKRTPLADFSPLLAEGARPARAARRHPTPCKEKPHYRRFSKYE